MPRIFSAPGRVNLIGEHTDYNDGFVLPMAIDRRTWVAAAANESRTVRVQSLDLNEEAVFQLDETATALEQRWLGYVAGVALELEKAGYNFSGADLIICSEVPIGAGLSSSAALEVSAGAALLALNNHHFEANTLALASLRAEHNYVGTRCGIMDQLTAAAARKGHVLLIDCRSLELTHVNLNLPETAIVICNTNVKHDLATSAYNQRRRECEEAVSLLRQKRPEIQALRDVTVNDLTAYRDELPELIFRRAHHVVSENARTLEAASTLNSGNLAEFGNLMKASHRSLRDDYEVSCAELDLMFELAVRHPGSLGARMTGGGFGGCTVNLVRLEDVESFSEFVAKEYHSQTGIEADIFLIGSDHGVKETIIEG